MAETDKRRSLAKRITLVVGGFIAFTLLFAVACRIAVEQLFRGIESSRATGLASVWNTRAMWGDVGSSGGYQLESGHLISRNADLLLQTDAFDRGRTSVNQIAAAHHGFLEHLATKGRTGRGRVLSATVSVPATQFDVALADLKKLGTVEAMAEGGEDSAVKLENAARNVEATKITLERLQNLQRDRKGQLHDALEVEKEIAQTDSAVREAIRQRDNLLSTLAQAHIQLTLLEDFRAPLVAGFGGAWLGIRNPIIEGVSTTLSSLTTMFGMAFAYGLPIAFWGFILFWPGKAAWRHLRARTAAL